jgi:transcriptional regulator with XRE-family HTH domain
VDIVERQFNNNERDLMAVSLAQRLKELRLKKKQSLQDVADAVNASKAHVWELETGKSSNPSMDLLSKLAEHFGVPVAQLIGEDPHASQEDQELVAMFRNLKDLTPRDREILRSTMLSMKKIKG